MSSSTLWCEIENPNSGACGLGSSEDGAIVTMGMLMRACEVCEWC